MESYQRVVAEINLDALQHNIKQIKNILHPQSKIMGVVKADAYGHGAIEVSKVLIEQGVERLAVAILEEGIQLREAGIQVPILILGYTPPCQAKIAVQYHLTPTVFTYEIAQAFSKAGEEYNQVVPIHLKMDTGMGRIGFLVKEQSLEEIERIKNLPYLQIEGIYTHFSTADEEDQSFTCQQMNQFYSFIHRLEKRGINVPIKHASNSAGIIEFEEGHFNLVRPGIILYGLYPSASINQEKLKLYPVMSLKTHISHIKEVEKGVPISYGRTYITEKKTLVATLPVGYADGYSRRLSPGGKVLIRGIKVPIIGRICMDQCMVDITNIPQAQIGDEVVLMGTQGRQSILAEEIADVLGTIHYEVVCMVGKRIPRVYVKNHHLIKMVDYF